MAKKPNKSPAVQAKGVSPVNGQAPPEETRFQPGQSGNPAGRPPNAGATIKEWINSLVAKGLTEDEIRQIARDRKQPIAKRAAAERLLVMIEAPDMADYEPLLQGVATLQTLRTTGVNTEPIKKVKQKFRKYKNEQGQEIEETEREIELLHRGGDDFDRVMDRTIGKPIQDVNTTINIPHAVQIITPLTRGKEQEQ